MTTVEKLFVQFNERKKSILELVNRRTELYSQHLASKLLIDGFNPPSWLLDPNSSSGTQELNKEDLISKLLRPYPQPSASCSVVHYPGYGNLVLTGDNEEFSDRDFVENPTLNKNIDRKNDPTSPGFSGQACGEYVLNSVPELDASVDIDRKNDPTATGFSGLARGDYVLKSVTELDASVASPSDQADERILHVDTAPNASVDIDRKNDPTATGFSGLARGDYVLKSVTELDASIASPSDQADERILHVDTAPNASVDIDRKNDPTATGFSGLARGECVLKWVPELDASVASPSNQADEWILNVDTAPDQSLARIQRSKSRQKALELRSSAKALAKSGLRHESISDVVSSQIRFSLSIANQSCQNDELSQLAEPCVIGSQSCENRNVVEAHSLSRETEVGTFSERDTRPESYAEISVKGSFSLGCSSENYKENAYSQSARARRTVSMPISNSEHADYHVTKSPTSTGALAVCCESFRDRGVEDADFLCKDVETNAYNGEITRSEISSKQQSCGRDSTKTNISSDDHQGIDTTMMDSGDDPPPHFVDGSLVKVNLSNIRNEGSEFQESGLNDFRRHKERDTFPSLSCIQHNDFIDEISHLEVPFASTKIHGGILAPSSAGSTRQVNDLQELSGLVKPSVGLFCRVTRSQSQSHGGETYQPVMYNEDSSFRGTKAISDCEESSSLVKVNHSNVLNEGCDAQESGLKDFRRNEERETCPSSSSIHHIVINEISHLEVPSASAKVYHPVTYNEDSSFRGIKSISDFEEGSSLVKVNLSNVLNEGCDTQESGLEDFRRNKESDTYPSSSSIKHNVINEISHLEVPSGSAKVYQPVTYNEDSSFGGTKSISDCEESSSLVKVNLSNVLNEGCDAQESGLEDFRRNEERDTYSSSSSIQHNVINDISHLEVPSASAKVHGCILAPSSAGSTRQVNDSQELSGLVKSSVGLIRRVTRSQSRSYGSDSYQPVTYNGNHSFGGTKSISDCEEKSAEKLHNTSSGGSVQACLGTHNMLHDDKNGNLVVSTKPIIGLGSEVALIPSDSCVSVEPKQLEFKETEEFNLKAFTSRSAKRSLDNLPQKMSCSLHVPDVSLDRGICGENNQPSSSKQLLRMSDVSCKEEKAHMDSFVPDGQKSPDNQAGNIGSAIGNAILNAFDDSTEAELSCRSSEVQEEADNLPSKMADIIDIQNPPVKPHVKQGLESSPVHFMEQGEFSDEGRDNGQMVSSVSESKNSMLSYGHSSADGPVAKSYDCLIMKVGTDPIAINGTKQDLAHKSSLENNHLGRPSTVRLHGSNSSLETARIESWPQVKRRKVEHQQAHFTTSQIFRVTKPHSFKRDLDNTYPKNMEIDVDTGLMDRVICSEVNTNQMEGIQSAILSQPAEVGPCYIEKNEHKNTSPVINNKQLGTTISSSTMKESRISQGSFIERTRTSTSSCDYLDAGTSGDKQCSQHLRNLENYTDDINSEKLNLSSALHREIQQSPKWEDGLHIQHSVISSGNGYLPFTDVDQSIPEFEGFIVNAQTDTGELDFTADGFGLGELELPRTALERASFLAEICKSASMDTPSTHFSSAFKFGTQNLCKSVPDDGHLTLMEFGNSYPSNPDVGIHFQSCSSSSDDYKEVLDGMQYSVSLPYSGERYGWNSRNQPSSPVGKLWDQLSSHSGSSGKGLSSNPELTCFPIEEDPSSSEDNNTMEENAGDTQDETDSLLANHCDKSQPLADLTNIGKKTPMSVYAKEHTLRADSVDFLSSKFSVTGTEDKALLGPKQTDGRKHHFSSIGPNAIKRVKESVNNSTSKSINNSISRSVVLNKTTLKGKLSMKEPRKNNIVSNVTSFIPLMQQKQAATACTGKRDVKVKALEAAEAAKLLEEKKENERKMRKEALKLERAKMEEKNLRHIELEKKKKEEERKKKDADIIVKKRLREEEEKKEKLKKRMRLETRQQQREQEEKKRAKRPEKENQRTKDDQMNNKKEFNNESKRQQNRPTTGGESLALQKKEINLTLNEVEMNYEECGTSGLSSREAMHAVDKSPRKEDLIVQHSQGKSYEISPYQCSDDEDNEDYELPTNKNIPSWGSKSSVALFVPLQQELDPDVFFPWDRSCSMDEVLLPRKQQQKRVAA